MEHLMVPENTERRQRRSSYQERMFSQKKLDRSVLITKYNKRKMTDTCWIFAYGILSFIVISAFFYSYILEKQKNIFRPEDPNGRKCGEGQALSYPYIYFPVPFAGTLHHAICVKNCPKSPDDRIQCLKNSIISNCEFNMHDIFNRTNQFIVYPTSTNNFLNMCQPDSRILFDAVNSQINTYSLFMNLQQIYESLYIILIACPLISISMVIAYVCIITKIKDLTYFFGGFILSFIILMIAFSIYSFTSGAKQQISIYMPILGGVIFFLTIIFIGILVRYNHYFKKGLELINYGAQYVRQNRMLIFMSLALFLIWIFVFGLQVIALVFIYSIDSSSIAKQEYQFPYFTVIQHSLLVKILIVLAIIHYFWTNLILYSMGEYICMAASCFWILDVTHNFKNSLFSLLRFHMGSVILGSIVNTSLGKITQLLFCCMPNNNGRCSTCCVKCQCLTKFYKGNCFTKWVGIYDDLNYIQVAMNGDDLVTAGRFISKILVQHMYSVHRAYRLARLIVFTSKILVAFMTTLICYAIIELSPNIRGYFLTNIIIFLFSSFLSSFAFDSYDRSFEVILITILICQIKKDEDTLNKMFLMNPLLANPDPTNQNAKQRLFSRIWMWFNDQSNREKQREQKQEGSVNQNRNI